MAVVLGIVSFTRMTADLLPDMTLPYAIVMTSYTGASPETVETVVTRPLEEAMATVSNIESINSVSGENYSMIILEFAQTTDMDSVSLEIREKLDQITGFWKDDLIGKPMILKLNPDMMPIMVAAAGMEGKDLPEVSSYVKDVVVPELESLEGVASVIPSGLIEENVNVVIRQDKIDKINAEIRESIDSRMEDTEQELQESREKISEGLAGLKKEKAKLDESQQQLDLSKTMMLMSEEQIQQAQASIDEGRKSVEAAEAKMKSGLKEIEDGEQRLEEAREEAYDRADLSEVLTADLVTAMLKAQNFSMPAGYISEEDVPYLVRIGDKPEDAEEMAELPVLDPGMEGMDVITLEDVADVFYVDNSEDVYTNINGNAGVMISVQKQTGYSTGEISDRILDRFQELMDEEPDLKLIPLMNQGIYIDLVMDSILVNVIAGAVLAILILFVFLKDIRPTGIVAVSIPISLVTAVVLMYFSGVTLNVVSLSGLALGIGMLVDNSIVVIENIYRLRSEGRPMKEAAVEGAKEVTGAIVASTLTTVCVFAPIVFTKGITRQLFVDMGLTIAYSLLASLAIAMTVVPAMASRMLNKTAVRKESGFYRALVNGYEKLLRLSLKGKAVVFILVCVFLAGSFFLAVSRGTSFMSDMDSTQFMVNVQLDEDATLEDTRTVTDTLIERILDIEEVENVGAMVSASSMQMLTGEANGIQNAASIYVTTSENKKKSNDEIGDLILERSRDLDAEITVDTSSMDMSAMGGSGIRIQVEGRNLETMREIAGDIAEIVKGVEGTAEVSDGMEETTEELKVTVNKEKASEHGLTVAQIYQQVSDRLRESGAATTLAEQSKDYGVYVIEEKTEELTGSRLRTFLLQGTGTNGEAEEIPLSEVADFTVTQSLNAIHREGQTRYITVSAALKDGYNIGLVSGEVEEAVKKYEMPDGYHLKFAGENKTIKDAMEQVLLMLVLALVFMYLIMVAQFQSLLLPFIIMFTIPLAFTGGFFGLFITGNEVSVIAMIGFVMLSGIIVNNGIVLIDFMNQLRESGMDKKEAIVLAGKTRLRPVLMTALTTILGLLSMVFSRKMGAEMMRPMAIVVIGGLLYGTLLTVIVIPCIYDLFTGKRKKEKTEALEHSGN